MNFAAINGVVTHFRDEGPRDGRPIVFVNSLGSDFRIWDDVAAALAPTRHLIRYDKAGHGLSALRAGATDMVDFALDLAALLDRLETGPATIVGLSIGGMIALELVRQRPDCVASLVLCDTGHKIGTHDSWTTRIETIDMGGIEAVADGVLARWFTQNFRDTQPAAMAGWRAMLTRTPQAGYVAACEAIRGTDLTEVATRIRKPTLCVVGDEDGSTPVALVRELSQLIRGAGFQIITAAGHLPCIEKPAVLARLIDAHCEGLSA